MELSKRSLKLPAVVIAAMACSLVSSCLPDPLEVDSIPQAREEIVVSSMIVRDQSLLVLLTRTLGALDASDDSDPQALLADIAINDAVVTIEGPQGKDTLAFIGSGAYGGVAIPFEAGQRYELYVRSGSLGEVYASTQVKRKISFREIDAELYYNNYDDTLAQITYALKDPAEENFYMINVQEVEREDFVGNLLNPRAFTLLLSDEQFNGNEFGEQFLVSPMDFQPGDSIAVSLSNISEDYYEFIRLRLDNRFSFIEFVSEPVDYPSNVIGGRGYFNLYVPDVRFIVLD